MIFPAESRGKIWYVFVYYTLLSLKYKIFEDSFLAFLTGKYIVIKKRRIYEYHP